jgi:SAM-dependent methyltransferase
MNNVQTFSQHSGGYARHRPTYPAGLFGYLASTTTAQTAAWDCATGNGQAAVACAGFFGHVEATDLSFEQIRHRWPQPRVSYRVCAAEQAPYAAASFDLVVVAEALHWFDLHRFYPELRRVLKPGGVFAVLGYAFFQIEPEIDAAIRQHMLDPIDPYWAPGNRVVMDGYRSLPFPVDEIPTPPVFEMDVAWSLPQLIDYARTWSALKRYTAETGRDPLPGLHAALLPLWGSADTVRRVHMPLFFRVGRKAG